nr:MFS transporter [Actinoplanes sp. RD1]
MLADRARAVAYTGTLVAGLALYGLAFFLMLYVQNVLGLQSLRAGLAFLTFAVPLGAAAILSGHIVTRTGTRPTLLAGLLLAATGAAGLALQATATAHIQI